MFLLLHSAPRDVERAQGAMTLPVCGTEVRELPECAPIVHIRAYLYTRLAETRTISPGRGARK